MKVMLETLEGRTLLAGNGFGPGAGLLARAEGVDDPAVQLTVAAIAADQAAIAAAKEQLRTDATDTREALQAAREAALERLTTARQAVRDARGDAEALQAAKAELRSLREQLRADIAAAREALRADTAESREALRTALTSLRDHLRQLRIDLQNAGVTRPAPRGPEAGEPSGEGARVGREVGQHLRDIRGDVTLTPDQAQTISDTINSVAQNIGSIDQTAVDALTTAVIVAAQDSTLTPEERRELGENARAVVRSIDFSTVNVREIARELHDVFHELAGR